MLDADRREALRGHAAMLAFSALIAGSFSLGAMAAPKIDAAALNTARFALAGVVMGALAFAAGRVRRETFDAPWRYLLLGGFFAAYFVLMFVGLKTAAPVSAAAVFTLTPVMSAGFGWLLMRQRMTGRMAGALALGALGALWVVFRGDLRAAAQLQVGAGEAIYFAGCVSHAVYTPLARKLNRGEHPLGYSFAILLASLVILLVWGGRASLATDWSGLPAVVWITIVYTAIFAGAATFTLLQFATLRLPSAKVMAYTYLTPSWVIGWEVALGHGLPPGLVVVGVVLTAVALLLLLKEE